MTNGVVQQVLPESDDGTEGPIPIDLGFPFGSSVQTVFYVSTVDSGSPTPYYVDILSCLQIGTNGLLSFGSSYNSFSSQQFPGSFFISSLYLVAPYWDDIDIRGDSGVISYEIHEDGYFLDLVNNFLQRSRPSSFVGTWMAVVSWDAVHPFPGVTSPDVRHVARVVLPHL